MAEAIGNSLNQESFVFSSAGISAETIEADTINFLKAKGLDVSNNISKAVANIPNLDHYQVIVSLSEQGRVPSNPPTRRSALHGAWPSGEQR